MKTKVPTKVPKLGKTKNSVSKAPKLDYHLEVHANDFVYKGNAVNMYQALKDFVVSPSFPFSIKTRVFMKYGKGDKECQKYLPVFQARRVFNNVEFKDSSLEILARKMDEEIAQNA